MALNIADGGLALDGSAKAMAGLPMQAFGITLSDDQLEELIAITQNGGSIELSLGSDPGIWINGEEFELPMLADDYDYDIYYGDAASPKTISKLSEPVMPVHLASNASRPGAKKSAKTTEEADNDAIANLKSSLAKVASDKRENSAVVVGGFLPSKGKVKPGNRLLDTASPRSLPPSPLLSGVRSPSIQPGNTTSVDRARQPTFAIIHELALLDGQSFQELRVKWSEWSDQEFTDALNKVADFDSSLQKWLLKKRCWKELDVFEYVYATEQDREQAINNAIKQYDRMRLATTDSLWQKLLPVSERGKGVCLSKLQQALARGPPAPKAKTDGTNSSGGDSEKDDSAGLGLKKGKGGEAMSRSSSQASTIGKKKLSASEAQAKRLLSNKKSTTTAPAKATPKVSPVKPATKPAAAGKGVRVLSKEFVTDSDISDDDEVPLAASIAKSKPLAVMASRAPKEPLPAKPKPKPTTAIKTVPKEVEKEKDTIRAEVVAKSIKQPVKRPRSSDDDDSSSSGTPLSKRAKPTNKPTAKPSATTATNSTGLRRASDASQSGRGVGLATTASVPKSKNTSPMKSSPLASSPPTNASNIEQERAARARALERERRQRDRSQDTISSSGSSAGGRAVGIPSSKKRPRSDSVSDTSSGKRQRVSQDTLNKAFKFKQFYTRYKQLHQEINDLEDPDPVKLSDLCEMHDRLKKMKDEIYAEVPAEVY
ncbi:hypothetical protein QBC44DRAFT_254246 [Cladorrhinum sp. PSN332]|nr:hypothetical protein QBC44DRAFT_254246 [Cladorrhinum sp. PSN332]